MCTVREIREAIQENFQSQMDMEMIEIDRIFQTFPFTQEQDIFSKPLVPKPQYWCRKGKQRSCPPQLYN